MKRRSFLKMLGMSPAAAVLPAAAKPPEIQPVAKPIVHSTGVWYGTLTGINAIPIGDSHFARILRQQQADLLKREIQKGVPKFKAFSDLKDDYK